MSSRQWLFVCSCMALITSAFTFSIRGDILQEMGNYFGLSQQQRGGIGGGAFLGMAVSMLGGGFICDFLGMKRIMFLALFSHLAGSLGMIHAPHLDSTQNTYYWLYAASFLQGCGNGFTEVAINPLIATLYADKKTHYLNILHAWWPGGLIIGGLSAQFLVRPFFSGGLMGLQLWQVSMYMIVIPAVIYGAMLLPSAFPKTERVASGVSTGEMLMACVRPMFVLWAFCMLLTAATELGPQQWQNSVMQSTAGVSGTLILVYTSGMMFVLRHFAGPIAHRLSPVGMLCGSSILAGVGLYLLSFANSGATAFGYATIFGLGIAYFWPTMLGVTAERFAKGGALALALMGSVGNLSISQVLPAMGGIVDRYAVERVDDAAPEQATQFVQTNDAGKQFLDMDAVNKYAVTYLTEHYPDQAAKFIEKNSAGEPVSVRARELAKFNAETPESQRLVIPGFEAAMSAQRTGFSMAFRWVSILPTVLVVIFGAIALWDRSRGGYKPEILISPEEEAELMSGGVQGAVE
ncbi:MAG: MFS transporter [Planctomycetia bacterium]|nr:MFS transporter [Planctomycetia bacterium]